MTTEKPDVLSRISTRLAGRRMKFLVVGMWLVLATVVAPLALKLTEVQNNESLGALPASAETRRAAERIGASFDGTGALVAVAVYARETGLTTADRATIEADRAAFTRYANDGQILPPVPSDDGTAMLMAFPLTGTDDEQSAATAEIKKRLVADRESGLVTGLTGSAGALDDIFDAFSGIDGVLLLATASVVALLLLVTYRSPVLWLIPLIVVGVANQLAGAIVYLLAEYGGITIDFQGQSVMTVLVFGVGVDYALLLISRYREELRRHADRHRAMAAALRRCLPAIVASAATVALGLLCLLAAVMPSTRSLGPVGAVGIAAALIAMTTLLPALLVLCGRWLFWPFVPRAGTESTAGRGGWDRVARVIERRPRRVWIGTALVLAGLTLGIGKLSLGLPGTEVFTTEVGSVTAQRIVERHYPGGAAEPAEIVAPASAAEPVLAAARTVAGVAGLGTPVTSTDGQWVRVQAVLDAPPDSEAATRTVLALRAAVHRASGEALVGGDTAEEYDMGRASDRDNRVVMPLILGVVLLILMLLLRAVVAPLLLIASVVFSFAAALGAAGFILTAMGHPKLFDGLPLQAFLFLVALGVDYTIFLMTRAREEVVSRRAHGPAVLRALTVTGGVITSAGIVLAATFAALGVLPLVPSVQVGVVVAVGVLLDTLLVRSLLVPALSVHIGPRIWWPHPIARG